MDQAYGYVIYRTKLTNVTSGTLKIKDLRDYGIVFLNGKRVGILDRRLAQDSMQLNVPKGNITLDILVENMGRINFGKYLLQNKKGITEKVTLAGTELKNWEIYQFPFDQEKITASKTTKTIAQDLPTLKHTSFNLDSVGDTYLDMTTWGKGVVWINGHNLGKYWSIGPQQTLYVPAEWLKKGTNSITVLELLKPQENFLKANDKPILNVLQKK